MKALQPIPEDIVIAIHDDQIKQFGGLSGLRDKALLDSALAQPFATFDGEDLYPSIAEKAARYGFGIIKNHPFADGNKRTSTALMLVFLRCNGCRFKPRTDDFYNAVVGVADGSMSFEELVDWLKQNAHELP